MDKVDEIVRLLELDSEIQGVIVRYLIDGYAEERNSVLQSMFKAGCDSEKIDSHGRRQLSWPVGVNYLGR